MKKIFAIALALVMVLSMASAFAFVGTCGKYEWTCDTAKCGVAKAEVVQFVANNTIDRYEESTCAAVVVGRALNYGVKFTFDKDVNPQWFYHKNTKLVIETSGMKGTAKFEYNLSELTGKKGPADVSGKTYWLREVGGKYELVSDWEPACVFGDIALTTRANVTAKVGYDFNGVTVNPSDLTYHKNPDNLSTEWIDYGDFQVRVHKNYGGKVEYAITVKKGGDVYTVWVINGIAKYVSETNAADVISSATNTAQQNANAATATAAAALATAQSNYDAAALAEKTAKDNLAKAQADVAAAQDRVNKAQAAANAATAELAAAQAALAALQQAQGATTDDLYAAQKRVDAATAADAAAQTELTAAQAALATAQTALTTAQGVNITALEQATATAKAALDQAQAAYDVAAAASGALATAPTAYYNKYDGTSFSGVKGSLILATGTITGTPTSTNNCSDLARMLQMINIKLGDCVKGSTIKAIFGWEDSASSKATWNKNALAIVNAECQVAIPKTGDVSVVAYAVMALVAAAGAMGLKK